MANTNISFDRTKTKGIALGNMMGNMEAALKELGIFGGPSLLGNMVLMINGDGTLDSHYNVITTEFGFVGGDAVSHAAFNELVSLQSKLNTDNAVTNVVSAVSQAINKFR